MEKILFLDTETGGLDCKKHSLLTVGMIAVLYKNKSFEILEEFHVGVKYEKYNIEKEALEVNNINIAEHEKTAFSKDDVKKAIKDFVFKHKLSECLLVGHNPEFDIGFMKELFSEKEYPFYRHYIDTKQIWCYLKFREKVPPGLYNHLKDISEYFEIDYSNAHNALTDCKITLEVFKRLVNLE